VPFKPGIKEQIITNILGAIVIHAKPTEIVSEKGRRIEFGECGVNVSGIKENISLRFGLDHL